MRLRPAADVTPLTGARKIDPARFGPWDELARRHPGISFSAAYEGRHLDAWASVTKGLRTTERSVKRGERSHLFYVDAPPRTDFDRLADDLRAWDAVERAWVRRGAPPPAVSPANDASWPVQFHLDPSGSVRASDGLDYDGIDAEYAWEFPGGDGAGVRIIDIEGGCNTAHPDLVGLPWIPRLANVAADPTPAPVTTSGDPGPQLVAGVNVPGYREHGTAMLGIVCAEDGQAHVVGIAPNVERAGVVSSATDASGVESLESIEQAIAYAIETGPSRLRAGDVLLLERQLWIPEPVPRGAPPTGLGYLVPLEADPEICSDLADVADLGILVVQAGGNGRAPDGVAQGDIGLDVTTYVDGAGRDVLAPPPEDNGSILVSAGVPAGTMRRTRQPWAPFGDRVDCWAWGDAVITASGTSGVSQTGVGGTSAAAAMVAGVVADLQGIVRATGRRPLTPLRMRDLLRDPANGTPQRAADAAGGFRIGAMPDLRKILAFAISPFGLYVRSGPLDLGDEDVAERVAGRCPDVFVTPRFPLGPVGPDLDPTPPVVEGAEYVVRATVHNRGTTTWPDAWVDVYWAAPATLLTPDAWRRIGRAAVGVVPPQGSVASAPLSWTPDGVPPDGSVALAVTLGTDIAPAPQPTDLESWSAFTRFSAVPGRLATRCVVRASQAATGGDAAGSWIELPFLIAGAPDERQDFTLTLAPQLPEAARVVLETRAHVLETLRGSVAAARRDDRTASVSFAAHKPTVLDHVRFEPGLREPAVLRVWIPPSERTVPHGISIVQSWHGREVGRLTWILTP